MQYSNPVRVLPADVESVKEKSKKTIENIHSMFESNDALDQKLKSIKDENPKFSTTGMSPEKLQRLANEYNEDTKANWIFESFDYEKNRGAMSKFVQSKQLEGYKMFNAVIANNKIANLIMYK